MNSEVFKEEWQRMLAHERQQQHCHKRNSEKEILIPNHPN